MPVVNIKGVGKAQFPDTMDIQDIRTFLRKKYYNDAVNGVSRVLDPAPQTLENYNPSLAERAGNKIGETLKDTGLISDNYGAQNIGHNLTSLGEFLPVIGDATAGDEFGKALAQGDKTAMAMSALGVIPVVGDELKKGAKLLKTGRFNIDKNVLNSDYVGYNIPEATRSFKDDYPRTIGQHGDLLGETIDGDKLIAKYVAGRERVDEADSIISSAEIEELGREKGATFTPKTKTELKGYAGEIKNPKSGEVKISFDKNLPISKQDIVKAHEVAHLIDEQAGKLNTKGIKKELQFLYGELNTPNYRDTLKLKQLAQPKYDQDRELSAEAIRLYLTNPSHIKNKYPKVAKAIRSLVNNNPKLNKTIQFNSALAGAVLLNNINPQKGGAE